MKILDVQEILFRVEDDGAVLLCSGSIAIKVCDDPSQFNDFVQEVVEQLNTIGDEIKEYHT